MRYTKKVSVWPVGLVGGLKWEGPICKDGSVIKFYTLWNPERPMPVDMAGFAINVQLIIDNPSAVMDTFASRGYLESSIVSKLATREEFEPLANNCKQVFLCSYITLLFKLLAFGNKGRMRLKWSYLVALENSRHIATSRLVSPRNYERRNSILIACHYPDLGTSDFNCLKFCFNQSEALPWSGG